MIRRSFAAAGLAALLGFGAGPARSAEPLKVVASFSILADMVRQVGGERVSVTTLVGPDGDAHVYQPTPADAKALAASRLLVVNGLGLEGWMSRLQRSSGFKGQVVAASLGVSPQQIVDDHGPGRPNGGAKTIADPHAWQNLANGKIYVANIRDGLVKADPANKAAYDANAAAYAAAMDALDREVRAAMKAIPPSARRIITSHDAFGYFGKAYGMEFIAPEGVSTESEASARDVARIIRQIKAEKIPAVFLETISDGRLIEQIGRESGARIGGSLFSDALSRPDGPAPTYLAMFRHNVKTLAAALTP